MTSHIEGTTFNANSTSLEIHDLSDDGAICFSAEASNGTKVVNVIGNYDGGKSDSTIIMYAIVSLLK